MSAQHGYGDRSDCLCGRNFATVRGLREHLTKARLAAHHPDCYQSTGVPDGLPPGLCDCRVLDRDRGAGMSAAYVRSHYGIDYRCGDRITVDGKPGTIVSFPDQYLGVRFDGEKHTSRGHPMWRVARIEGEA